MAFDITKNLATQVFPKVEVPDVRSPMRVDRPEKISDHLRSFRDELASEPAKNADTAKKAATQAIDAVRRNAEQPSRLDQGITSGAAHSPLEHADTIAKNPLKQLGGDYQEDILSSPAAALLAGQMQAVSPQQLQDLVGQNQFLSDVLFGADAEAVIGQKQDIQSLLDSLGVSGDVIASLKAEFGDDLPNISAADLFAAAGLDPAQMLARLNALRNQFVEQIDPAALVSGQPQVMGGDLNETVSGQNGNSAGRKIIRSLPDALSGLQENNEIGGLKQAVIGASGVEFGGPVPGAASAHWTAASAAATDVANSASTVTSSPGEAAPTRFGEFKNWRDGVKDLSAQLNPESAAFQPTSLQSPSAVPMGRKATFDGFHELGQRIEKLSPEQVTKVDLVQNVKESTPESTPSVPKFMEAVINRFGMAGQAVGKSGAGLKAEPMTPVVTIDGIGQDVVPEGKGDEKAVLINGKPEHLVKGLQTNLQQGAALADDAGAKILLDTAARKFSVDEFMADVTAGRMSLDLTQSDADSFTQSDGGDLSRFAGQQLSGNVPNGLEKPQAFGTDFAAMLNDTQQGAHTGMTTAERADMAQKVLDNATFLMRQGSGSVRLDLSNANVGPLEVAINLADNKVDIKVFTESDPVREAMIADLSRLKDALQTQNVNLNHVEVGVGQRFGGSAGSDQNRQFAQQQEMREAFADNLFSSRSNTAAGSKSEIAPVATARRLNQLTTRVDANGQLQIRI